MSAFILKIIALLVMFTDHSGVVFQPLFNVDLMRCIGRIAFPIFIFFIAEGCRHTHNIRLYMFRLGLFALISEFPFDLATAAYTPAPGGFSLHSLNFWADQNVFFTFFLGVLCVYLFQTFNKRPYQFIYVILIPFVIWLGDKLHTDYGSAGVLFVFILYILPYGPREAGKPLTMSAKGKVYRLIALFCLLFYLYIIGWMNFTNARMILRTGGFITLLEKLPQVFYDPEFAVNLMLFSCVSLFLLAFYNNERGKPLKWFFYTAYPLHLFILGVIRIIYVIPKAYGMH